jgi:hypothetical protein
VRITRSTGNVFRALGFSTEEAEHLLIRSDLMVAAQTAIQRRGLKQAEAAKILGVRQPREGGRQRSRSPAPVHDPAGIDWNASLNRQPSSLFSVVVGPSTCLATLLWCLGRHMLDRPRKSRRV